jgi:hypothetical protein
VVRKAKQIATERRDVVNITAFSLHAEGHFEFLEVHQEQRQHVVRIIPLSFAE